MNKIKQNKVKIFNLKNLKIIIFYKSKDKFIKKVFILPKNLIFLKLLKLFKKYLFKILKFKNKIYKFLVKVKYKNKTILELVL